MFSALRLLHLSSVTLFLRKNIAFSAHFVVRPTALRQIIFNSEKSLNMAQRSITSFFAKSNGAAPIAETKKTGEDAVNLKPGKRERSLTGDSESPKAKVEKIKNSPKAKTAPKKTPKKKSVTEDTEKVTSNEDIAKKTPKKTPKKKSVTEDTKKVTSNGDITKIAPKKMPKKKSVTEDTKKVTSNEDIEMKSCNTTTLSSEVKENVPEDIKTELKTEPSTINDEEKSPSNSSKGEKRKSSDKAKKSPTQKKEAIVEAKTETEPIADVDESTTDPNFKLEFSDEDSPIKVTKKPRKSRVSSSSSDDSPSPRKSPTKSDSKPSQVHSFFSKKTPESKKSETANADAKSDDTATKDKPAQKNWLLDSNESSAKDVGAVYTPSKSQYHPVNDACWTKGEPVPYLALARTLEEIENTSARLKIVDILANFLRSVIVLTPEDLVPAVYLCLNKVAPAYESVELGVAETYLMKAIAQSTGRKLGQVKTLVEGAGDLGLAAEKARGAQMVMHRPPPLTLQAIIKGLREITKMTGNASMTKKINKIQTMFVACRHSEARYFIRSLAGKLRIGLAEQSVLQALAQAASLTPPNQDILNASKGMSPESFKAIVDQNALIIKTTYCELPNYDIIIPTLLEHGVAALPDKCKLTPGVPLKPMLAHPTRGVNEIFQRFEGCNFTCEWKYDGERAQIHVPALDDKADLEGAKIFSRNQEDNTSKYPDVLSRLGSTLKDTVKSCVIDCEAVAWDMENEKILPFQILSTRKRKDANIADIKVNVCLFMFDLLYFNGKSLVAEPMEVRRQLLRDNFKEIKGVWLFATSRDCSTIDEVQEFLEESVKGSCEGLMVKTLSGKDATYQIAKRSKNWLKLKKDYLDGVGDTIDAVVIGGYKGRGKRAGVYGGFLLACYDPDTEEYQSLCKIGTGFSDEDLQNHADTLKQYITDGPRSYYRYDSSHSPDEWFSPSVVWEIRCADLSISPAHCAAIGHIQPDKGISLRFPRFLRIRDDKTPEGATSASQIARIYLSQDQVKNTAPSSKENADDDFY